MDIDALPITRLGRERIRELSRRSDARGLLQLATHAGLLALTSGLLFVSRGHAWLAAALLAQGVVLIFLFCALHECIHGTAFASPWLNDVLAWVCGALLLLPPEYFRSFHYAHHRFTQDLQRDPELALPPPASPAEYWWRVSGLPYWRERLQTSLRHALTGRVTERFVSAARAPAVVREARILWLYYAAIAVLSIYLHSAAALLYWIVPALLGQPFLRLFLLAEHTGCALDADMLANTRTTYTNAAVRLLTWRMPYHAEHHSFPSVPFHALARLNALLPAQGRVTSAGYVRLHCALLRELRAARTRARLAAR
ncbi:MAG: fatty acid desaturase [Gammaproteobacteria bacterium]|nr:fatty acid desaturase [Gammaproteobacteria bacterium]MBV9725637.1 fatty acid desaturase [Gammaproteobacteria bacterium]